MTPATQPQLLFAGEVKEARPKVRIDVLVHVHWLEFLDCVCIPDRTPLNGLIFSIWKKFPI